MGRVIFLMSMFTFLSRLSGEELATFVGPAGFYTVHYPADWHVAHDDSVVNISPPDDTGAVTISVYHGETATVELAKHLIQRVSKDWTVVSELAPMLHNNWNGITGEFNHMDDVGRRVWIVTAACRNGVLVLITANDLAEAMKSRRNAYQGILDSLVIKEPVSQR